eukprot:NODE_1339_length_1371_cov_34.389068_g1327_i0.p1 GENE.NODE_1339_length_1371_cov_34.389068_g1327_i0~~NODE_1339_length_1371_cov_34.389068_g1327_i0.p1  ORF type:complete len:397 (+),score=72.04 NODE_1339_length_1371_cov_34.389068_g1327_i0:59-1249(+)
MSDPSLTQVYAKHHTLVLDTNAFIQGGSFFTRAEKFVTTDDVITEVRDKKTLAFVEALPVQLCYCEPSPAAMKQVIDVAKQTGDYGFLSNTDIRLIGVAYDLHLKDKGLTAADAPPVQKVSTQFAVNEAQAAAQASPAGNAPQDGTPQDASAEAGDAPQAPPAAQDEEDGGDELVPVNADEDDSAEGSDDEGSGDSGEWVTPDNVHEHKQKETGQEDDQAVGVGLVTTDFPMQNVCLALGMQLVSLDSKRILGLRRWILRCHACYELVKDTRRSFCPACGSGDTLKKVSYTINEDGSMKLWINERHQIRTSGTKHKLPKPRAGHGRSGGTNRTVVLREDQLRNCGRGYDRSDPRARDLCDEDWFWGAKTTNKKVTHLAKESSWHKKRHGGGGRKRK